MRNSGNVRKSKPHVFHWPESFMNMKFNDEKIDYNVICYRHLIKHLLILVLQLKKFICVNFFRYQIQMKTLKRSLSPGLGARRACQMKWELIPKADRGAHHVEAPASIHHYRVIPWEGAAGPCSWSGLELGPRQRLQGNKFCLSLGKVVTAANRRPVLSRRHHWDRNVDFCLGQEGLGSAAVTNKPQTTVGFYQPRVLPSPHSESIMNLLGAESTSPALNAQSEGAVAVQVTVPGAVEGK